MMLENFNKIIVGAYGHKNLVLSICIFWCETSGILQFHPLVSGYILCSIFHEP